MDWIASQITSLTSVYSTVHSGADQRKHQSSASLAFVWEIHRWPVNFPHKWPVTRKMFPFGDVIMSMVIVDVIMLCRQSQINALRPRRHGRYFPDDIIKCIFVCENVWISIKISPKCVSQGTMNSIPALVQIMAWRRPGDNPLSEPWWLVCWRIYASLGLSELLT